MGVIWLWLTTSPVGFVVGGVIVAIVAHYAVRGLDSLLSRMSTRWKENSRRRAAELQMKIEELLGDQNGLVLLAIEVVKLRVNSAIMIMVALFLTVIVNQTQPGAGRLIGVLEAVGMWMSGVASYFGFWLFLQSKKLDSIRRRASGGKGPETERAE